MALQVKGTAFDTRELANLRGEDWHDQSKEVPTREGHDWMDRDLAGTYHGGGNPLQAPSSYGGGFPFQTSNFNGSGAPLPPHSYRLRPARTSLVRTART